MEIFVNHRPEVANFLFNIATFFGLSFLSYFATSQILSSSFRTLNVPLYFVFLSCSENQPLIKGQICSDQQQTIPSLFSSDRIEYTFWVGECQTKDQEIGVDTDFFDDYHHDLDRKIFLDEINRKFVDYKKEKDYDGDELIEMVHLEYWLRIHDEIWGRDVAVSHSCLFQ